MNSQTTAAPAELHRRRTQERQPLPPKDKGLAWLVCAGCSIIQLPVWGFSQTFGVFQAYYERAEEIRGNKSAVPNIGTAATGALYLCAPLTFALLERYPHLRPICGPVGVVLAVAGFLGSAWTDSVAGLIATQGVLAAVGCGLLYSPTTIYLDEWFFRRKGLAFGIVLGSKSLAGATLPFIVDAMLQRFGYKTTMQTWAVAFALLTVPLLFFLRPRIPLSERQAGRLSFGFVRLPSFWILQLGNILQALGYFLPTAYLISYANTIGLDPSVGTAMVALLNAANIPGSLIIGMLNDRFEVFDTVLIVAVGSTLSVFVFWGLAGQAALLAVFAIMYGFFAGGFSATWAGSTKYMKRKQDTIDTGLMFGLLAGVRGVGNVVSGPLSAALLQAKASNEGWTGYQTKYGWVIVFTGMSALLGGASWLYNFRMR